MLSLLLAVALLAPLQRVPDLLSMSRVPAPTGAEAELVDLLVEHLPPRLITSRDVFGSLVVRRVDDDTPIDTIVAVGLDTSGYVVSQIRDDGYLRLRALGDRPLPDGFHLAHEGQPVSVLTRDGALDGVVLIPSVHLGSERPAEFGEQHLWVDVGADDAAGVAALGVELLDPVVNHEVVTLRNGMVAGPGVGRRAVALALVRWLVEGGGEALPPDLAIAFVVQSLPGAGPLGRGGESLLRQLGARRVLVLDAGTGADATDVRDGVTWVRHELRVTYPGSRVELVAPDDLSIFDERLAAWLAAEGAQR